MEKKGEKKQDLRERTKVFASHIIRLYVSLPGRRTEVAVVGKQMLRSGTSVAANYREASRARSDAEFVSKIETCTQEADETQRRKICRNERIHACYRIVGVDRV